MNNFLTILILIACLGCVDCYAQQRPHDAHPHPVEGVLIDRWQERLETSQKQQLAEMRGLRDIVDQMRETSAQRLDEIRAENRGVIARLAETAATLRNQLDEAKAERIAARSEQATFFERLREWTPAQNIIDRISGLVASVTWLLVGVGVLLLVAVLVILFAAYVFLRVRKIAGV